MHLILGLAIGFMAILRFGLSGFIMGGLIGVLTAEVLALRKRVHSLERSAQSEKSPEDRIPQEIIFSPSAAEAVASKEVLRKKAATAPGMVPPAKEADRMAPVGPASFFDRFSARYRGKAKKIFGKISRFFTSGNLVLKIGIIIIFFGVAFLLKYAAQRNMVPIELRLIGVAVSGMAVLGIGWRLRRSRAGYGLVLQGGGVGILYLVVFAAARLYNFLPMTLSLAVMIGLVALSGMLAVLQEAKYLAVFGIVGGFLAPVLMSTGGGSHVMLFSYYALLNCGILGIAWFASWRELNLIGFIFTFAIGTLWGSSGYQPEYFTSTEPFLVLFFVFYVVISILFAQRQPINLRGFIDGPLVFGLPLVVSSLQYFLVRDLRYGMAFSALALGLFYLSLATLLWRRLSQSMHLLCEAFLALGVVFGSLAIPLALDGQWSASIWALEGAGMVWVGLRQKRLLARHFGIVLQLAAAYIFLDSVWYPFFAVPFANQYFLGCALLALAALFSSYFLDRYQSELKKWERYFPMPLMILGLIWWYIGGLREVDKQMAHIGMENGFLLFCCVGSLITGMACKKLAWPRLGLALYLQLPAMVLLALMGFADFSSRFHLFAGWGALAWTIAFVVQYRILYLFAGNWPTRNLVAWHLGTMWLLLFVLCDEGAWAMHQLPGLGEVWTTICWALIPSIFLLLLLQLGKGTSWPAGKYASDYLGIGGVLPALCLVLWLVESFRIAGDPLPLPYITLFNPVELSGLIVLIVLLLWLLRRTKAGYFIKHLPAKQSFWGLGVLFFCWVNSVVARSVHFYIGVPYNPDSLYHSVIFQAAIAALWGFGAMAMTVWATRKGSRALWGIGAILLGMVVLKLFAVDLSGTGTIARIISFLVVGVLMLIIGYFSPLPPKAEEISR